MDYFVQERAVNNFRYDVLCWGIERHQSIRTVFSKVSYPIKNKSVWL